MLGLSLALPLTLFALSWAGGCMARVANTQESPVEPLPPEPASQAFWDSWSDNQGEINAYSLTTPRYGELREGTSVLVYVLEQSDRRTWIKDDAGQVPEQHREVVMKLNEVMSFQTGIYPYRVMTSVFSPVNGIGRERFAPTRIVFTSQEWCGQVYHRLMPERELFTSEIRSYFSLEGEQTERVETEAYALYENALLIQLRELDGEFAAGTDWSGQIVPALWQRRRSHEPLEPVNATITRSVEQTEDGTEVNRFVLSYENYERTFDVERQGPRRILGWTTSEGEVARLLGTARLPYWRLQSMGDESFLEQIGLDQDGNAPESGEAEPDQDI